MLINKSYSLVFNEIEFFTVINMLCTIFIILFFIFLSLLKYSMITMDHIIISNRYRSIYNTFSIYFILGILLIVLLFIFPFFSTELFYLPIRTIDPNITRIDNLINIRCCFYFNIFRM